VPADEFRQHYRSLSDEGLFDIDRADLTEAARACYDEELASRGLAIERPRAPEVERPLDENGWVPLDTFDSEEIELVRGLLDAEGVPNNVESSAVEGVVLSVPEAFLGRAREILAAQISEQELIDEAEAYQPPEDA
jgi:hypothetical protein